MKKSLNMNMKVNQVHRKQIRAQRDQDIIEENLNVKFAFRKKLGNKLRKLKKML